MKINGAVLPNALTYEQAADLFLVTIVGRSAGLSRAEFLLFLRNKFPTQHDLDRFYQDFKLRMEAEMTPATGDYDLMDHGHAIRCNRCHKVSFSAGDVQHLYCGHCHKYHTAKQ